MLLPELVQQATQLSHQVKRQREQGHFHGLSRSADLVPDGLDSGRIEKRTARRAPVAAGVYLVRLHHPGGVQSLSTESALINRKRSLEQP